MKYKGYEALVTFDEDDRILCGRVLSTRDVISFEADCGFRSNPITESGASRSLIPIQPDH